MNKPLEESFNLSNNVLMHGVQSITDLMVRPGLINLDFDTLRLLWLRWKGYDGYW